MKRHLVVCALALAMLAGMSDGATWARESAVARWDIAVTVHPVRPAPCRAEWMPNANPALDDPYAEDCRP